MSALILAPIASSVAVGALSVLGVRPLGIIPALVALVGCCAVLA